MFEPKKFNDIFDAMQASTLKSGVLSDFEIGSVTRTLYESFAWEMAALYEKMNLVYLSAFVDTAQGSQLEKVVAILGIQRGEPEFADGRVIFDRDKTDDVLTVPVGTLVSTEESPEMPKKVFQTTENVTFGKGQATVEAPVQALIPGENQDAAAESITVMPRPLPGVKGVTNRNTIELLGKKQETDEELRRRAKSTLLASGKATTIAIENALLALPGVTDVQIREDFRFAQGRIEVTRKAGEATDIEIPAGSQVELIAGGQTVPLLYETLDGFTILASQSKVSIDIRSLLEGSAGEVKTNTLSKFTWHFKDAALDGKVTTTIAPNTALVRGNFGIIRVFVDGPDLANPDATDADEQKRYESALRTVRGELDRVRAAGIFSILESARPVMVDMALLIELDADQKPTAAERGDLENRTRDAVMDYFRQIRMEQPLVYSKLLRAITDVEGVGDLSALDITTRIMQAGNLMVKSHASAPFNKLEVEAYERFLPRDVCVASESKTLPVDFEFNLPTPAPNAEETTFNALKNALSTWFGQQKPGATINLPVALATLPNGTPAPAKIVLHAWCERVSLPKDPKPNSVFPTLFFEQAVLGTLFVYYRYLHIGGAVRLTMSASLKDDGRKAAKTAVEKAITLYLDSRPPETPVLLDDLTDLIKTVSGIEDVALEADDFNLQLSSGISAQDHLNKAKKRIEVRRFEKARLMPSQFLFAEGRVHLSIEITALTVRLFPAIKPDGTSVALTPEQKNAVKNALVVAVNSYFNAAEMGKEVSFNDFKSALEGLAVGVGYALEVFSFKAKSQDGREQTASLSNASDIQVRSMELPVMIPIATGNITTIPA